MEATINRRVYVLCTQPLPVCACGFRLNSLTDTRMDVVARCVTAALFVSCGTRRDCEVYFVFPRDGPTGSGMGRGEGGGGYWVLRFHGDEVRHLRPDERAIASVVAHRLYHGRVCRPAMGDHVPIQSREPSNPEPEVAKLLKCCKGLYLSEVPRLADILPSADDGVVLHMVEGAPRIEDTEPLRDPPRSAHRKPVSLVLGDDVGFTGTAARAKGKGGLGADINTELVAKGAVSVSLGRRSKLASQCIVIAHHYLDAAEEDVEERREAAVGIIRV